MSGRLTCRVDRSASAPVVHLTGSLDLATAPSVRGAIRDCLTLQPTAVIVDMAGLVSATTQALAFLAATTRQARLWPGTRIKLAGVTGEVSVVLRGLTGTSAERHLSVYPSIRDALVSAEEEPRPPERVARLVPDLDAPRLAREIVRDCCHRWGITDATGNAQLVASELVSNAVLHARTVFELSVRVRDGALCLAVRDSAHSSPRRRAALAEPAEHGRGLLLVQALTTRWGRSVLPDGKIVWACLGVRDGVIQRAVPS